MTQPYSDAPTPPPAPTPTTSHSGGSSLPDLRSLPPFDLGILIAGVLAFIVSFFPYYGASSSGATVAGQHIGGVSESVTAWHSYSTIALLLILLATAVSAVAIFAPTAAPQLPIGLRWIAAGLSALGGLLYVIRLFTLDHKSESVFGVKVTEGVKWGGYLLLIIVLIHVACSVISALSSDEEVPWHQGAAAPPAG
ncbi:MAG TPA: hypothetical protein VHW92_11880 [Mycobacteriales bacterium]|jgi:hypothetical protein|nr:hypothetical protein [Mycobacteriales bacterium]